MFLVLGVSYVTNGGLPDLDVSQILIFSMSPTLVFSTHSYQHKKPRPNLCVPEDASRHRYNMHSPKDLKEHLDMHENISDESQRDLPKLIIYREDRASGARRTTSNSSTTTTTSSQTPKKRSTKKDTTTETSPANNERNKLN